MWNINRLSHLLGVPFKKTPFVQKHDKQLAGPITYLSYSGLD